MYTLIIFFYSLGAHIAALFSKKVRLMIKGQHETFDKLRREIDSTQQYVWVHAASLGEFEQGRPLIERIRASHPHLKILLTFFSPSGYEVRKNYEGADVVCYLPFDTPLNARRFVRMANVKMAFFIKYEFWRNYIGALHRKGIPVYSVSSIFRPDQIFFKWYGKGYADCLRRITHFFVQNDASIELLKSLGITAATKTGDTRFDRVLDIMNQAKELPIVEAFAKGQKVLIAGSSWGPDEDLFIPYFNEAFDFSIKATKGHLGTLLLIGLVTTIIILLGTLCFGVGAIPATAFVYVAEAVVYLILSGQIEASQEGTTSREESFIVEK